MPQLLQLRSGQFLIGACEVGDDGTVQITDPFEVVIEPVRTPQGVIPQAGMFPYAMMAKNRTFKFEKDQIQMSPCEPDDNCANNWAQATGGITRASALDLPETKGGLLLQG